MCFLLHIIATTQITWFEATTTTTTSKEQQVLSCKSILSKSTIELNGTLCNATNPNRRASFSPDSSLEKVHSTYPRNEYERGMTRFHNITNLMAHCLL